MIVADTHLIAYLLIPGEQTLLVRAVLRRDPRWAAPLLWRSELRDVPALYLREQALSRGDALAFMTEAESVLEVREAVVETVRCCAWRRRPAAPRAAASSFSWRRRWGCRS